MKYLRKLSQTGDTIVEVMVVLAVLGLAISISFATANRSLLGTRSAEQASQANSLLQSQVESLRYLSTNGSPTDPSTNIFRTGQFCIDSSNNVSTDPSVCNNWDSGLFEVQITYSSATNVFTLVATWTDLQGQGTDTATLLYKLYQPAS